jgi:hypothetical protein
LLSCSFFSILFRFIPFCCFFFFSSVRKTNFGTPIVNLVSPYSLYSLPSRKMFRESDAPQRQPHPSFYNRPVPTFQAIAQNSKFDDSPSKDIRNYDINPVPVPVTWDTKLDPDHPDADYSGLVSKYHVQKRHSENPAAHRSHLITTEQGMCTQDETQQWPRKRKEENVRYNPITGEGSIIHGTGALTAEEHWKTNYQRMAMKESTTRDQLTLKRQQMPQQGARQDERQGSVPSSARGGSVPNTGRSLAAEAQLYRENMPPSRPPVVSSGVSVGRGGSFISDLGSSLVNRVPDFNIPTATRASGPRPKTLVLENYKLDSGKIR